MIFASVATVSFAGICSGKAEADWITATKSYEAGKPVQTAVRLVVDAGWHTYWLNPGEGGMKISAVWELPAGWTAGELEHPVPMRFVTGELPGFGYERTVVFPVKFTPPAGFTGEVKLKGKISWLTCNDQNCVPGSAALELSLTAGEAAATDEAKFIAAALLHIPQQNSEIILTVAESAKMLTLTLSHPATKRFDPADYEFFPATPQVVDAAAKFVFTHTANKWTAEVPKSEYATKAIQQLTLVLASKAKQPPLALTWTAEPAKSH